MTTASVYGWFVGNGLWPTSLAALLYWVIPVVAGFLVGKRVLGRVITAARELLQLARRHVAAQERTATAHEQILAHLTAPPTRQEDR